LKSGPLAAPGVRDLEPRRRAGRLQEGTRPMRWSRPKYGPLLLGIWLIATGVVALVPCLAASYEGIGTVLAVLAIVAGIALVLDR
jgi:hypothetical protein